MTEKGPLNTPYMCALHNSLSCLLKDQYPLWLRALTHRTMSVCSLWFSQLVNTQRQLPQAEEACSRVVFSVALSALGLLFAFSAGSFLLCRLHLAAFPRSPGRPGVTHTADKASGALPENQLQSPAASSQVFSPTSSAVTLSDLACTHHWRTDMRTKSALCQMPAHHKCLGSCASSFSDLGPDLDEICWCCQWQDHFWHTWTGRNGQSTNYSPKSQKTVCPLISVGQELRRCVSIPQQTWHSVHIQQFEESDTFSVCWVFRCFNNPLWLGPQDL